MLIHFNELHHNMRTQKVPKSAFGDLPGVLPFFFDTNNVLNKAENWFAALTNISILKRQNYWSHYKYLHL